MACSLLEELLYKKARWALASLSLSGNSVKHLACFVLGLTSTVLAYEHDIAPKQILEVEPEKAEEISYRFFDKLPSSSVIIIEDAYGVALDDASD